MESSHILVEVSLGEGSAHIRIPNFRGPQRKSEKHRYSERDSSPRSKR